MHDHFYNEIGNHNPTDNETKAEKKKNILKRQIKPSSFLTAWCPQITSRRKEKAFICKLPVQWVDENLSFENRNWYRLAKYYA